MGNPEKIELAKFISNLYNTGLNAHHEIRGALKKRIKYLTELRSSFGKNYSSYHYIETSCIEAEPKLFFLFHFSIYPSLVYYLCEKYGYTKIQFVVTEDSIDESAMLDRLQQAYPNKYEFEYVMIDSKGRFARRLIKNFKKGYVTFILADVPAGSTPGSRHAIPMFHKGNFYFKNGFYRLSKLLNTEGFLAFCRKEENQKNILVTIQNAESAENIFLRFSDLVSKHPYDYEKFDDIHKFYDGRSSGGVFFYDQFSKKNYVYRMNDSTCFEVKLPRNSIGKRVKKQDIGDEMLANLGVEFLV